MAFRWLRGTAAGGVLRAQASSDYPTTRTRINWGDGTSQVLDHNIDTDGDGVFDSVEVGHGYASDGIYRVATSVAAGGGNIITGWGTIALFANAISGQAIRPNSGSSSGADLVVGSVFGDRISTGGGADLIYGGGGDDIISAGDGASGDVVFGGTGNDTITAYSGRRETDELYGEDGDDFLASIFGDDLLDGGSGDDILVGGPNNDILMGGSGSDRLYGTVMRGGAPGETSADRFVFTPDDVSPSDRDVIMDFSSTDGDTIDLSSFEGSFHFAGTRFTGAVMEVRAVTFDTGSSFNTVVALDVDGDRLADLTIILRGVEQIASADFVL